MHRMLLVVATFVCIGHVHAFAPGHNSRRHNIVRSVHPHPHPHPHPHAPPQQSPEEHKQPATQDIMAALKKCTGQAGKWPTPEKFDLVISWWTKDPQSDIKTSGPPSLLQSSSSTRFENQAEIKYALRSYEQQGLLDHVSTVHILLDDDVIQKFGAPRFFNYSDKIRIVATKGTGSLGGKGSKWSQFVGLDKIPGLSPYFLWVPDDNFMMKPFDMKSLFDVAEGTPILRSYGSYSLGACDKMHPVGSTHGPIFMNKCSFEAVAEGMWRSKKWRAQKGLLNAEGSNTPIDVLCLYTHTMRSVWKWGGFDTSFHRECHTNAGRGCVSNNGWKPLFLNLQGNGISDEYGAKSAEWTAHQAQKLMPNGPARFFHDEFPTPSRFEKSAKKAKENNKKEELTRVSITASGEVVPAKKATENNKKEGLARNSVTASGEVVPEATA